MRVRIVEIAPELLRDALRLPNDVQIISLGAHADKLGCFRALLFSECFDDVVEGGLIPTGSPLITAKREECGHITTEWEW